MVLVLGRRHVSGWVLCTPTHQETVRPRVELAMGFGYRTLS